MARDGNLIGGDSSCLSSCCSGLFHFKPGQANSRFWISREEYQESGAGGPGMPCNLISSVH